MAQIFKNNTTGTLAAQLSAGATTCTLNAGHNFTDPGTDYYLATLIGVTGTTETSWEIVRVTDVSTNTLTITRAQESTADATWLAGTRIEARVTAASTESKANLGTAAYAATGAFAAASHNQAETTITFTDVSTGNASTTAHGFSPKATAPASGLVSVLAIGNGETVRSDKALFDTTNPAALGSVGPGTAVIAARRDHVHAMPSAANVGAAAASSFIAGAGALTGPAAPLTIGTAAAAATGDFAPAAKGVTNGDSHDHNGGDGAQIAYSSLSGLPSLGKILQVVAGTSTTEVTVSSGTYTDIGLSVAITPRDANSKILLLASFEVYVYEPGGGAVGAHTQLLRGSTVVQAKIWSPWARYESLITTVAYAVLDSPATASAITYKLQGKVSDYVSGMSTSFLDSGSPGSLIALEVAG
jgi:hypothetical protein